MYEDLSVTTTEVIRKKTSRPVMKVTAIVKIEHSDGGVEFMKFDIDNWNMKRELQKVYSCGRVIDFIPGPERITMSGMRI